MGFCTLTSRAWNQGLNMLIWPEWTIGTVVGISPADTSGTTSCARAQADQDVVGSLFNKLFKRDSFE